MSRTMHTRLAITLWRILMLYFAFAICHASFYIYNQDLIGDIGIGEIWSLFQGMILFDGASVSYTLLLFFIISILPFSERIYNSKPYRWIMFLSYIIPVASVLAINMGDVVYFHYTLKRCSTEEIAFAENGNTLRLMLQFMWENMTLVVIFIVMVTVIIWGYRIGFRTQDVVRLPQHPEQYGSRWKFRTQYLKSLLALVGIRLLFLLFVAYYAFGGIRGSYTSLERPMSLTNAMYYTMSPNKAFMILSNPFCIVQTISSSIEVPSYFEEEEIDDIYSTSHYPEDYHSEMFGRYKGYNVVIFILEGFSAEHSAHLLPELHSGKGYTPNLDRLMQDGLTFTQCYANGLVSRAAVSAIWCSMPSFGDKVFMLRQQSIAPTCSLPYLLDKAGYTTSFFSGAEKDSMGFGSYAHTVGIKNLFSMEDYILARTDDDYDGYWGIWDEPFMDYMGEVLSQQQQPLFASIFTITSHHPYNVPSHLATTLPKGTTRAHQSIAYTDRAVGQFMDKYRDEPWFQKTLFVFVADHVASERMAERSQTSPGLNHIVGFLYTPDGSLRGSYDHTVSQIDIMPTLLGLLGNDEPYFGFGRDIFNEPQREVFEVIPSHFSIIGMTDEHYVEFAYDNIVGVYARSDHNHRNNFIDTFDTGHIDTLIKAHQQQYYTKLKNMDYLPAERK